MSQKLAVVVGGTGEIGRGVLDIMVREGYFTICVSRPPKISIERKANVEYYFRDMTKLEQIEECFSAIANKHKKVDVLINLIGENKIGTLCEITEEIWDAVIDSNLKSIFFICRTGAELVKKDGGGSIINFTSTAGIRALPQSPHYIAAKAGVIALTKYYAQILAPEVKVNCIAPGFVLTNSHTPENYLNYNNAINHLPLKQMSSIEEVAEAVLFLINSKTITGHTLVVDGGLIL